MKIICCKDIKHMLQRQNVSNCLRPSRHRAHWYYWSTGGLQDSVTILYCAWSFVAQKLSKTGRNAGLFLHFLFYALRHVWGRNITKIWSKSYKKEAKMEAWGGSGDSWGSSWRHLGPNTAQSSKKLKKVSPSTPPRDPQGDPKIFRNPSKYQKRG